MLVKTRLCSKRETPRLQHFLPWKLGSFKEACFTLAFLCFFKKLKACFLVLFLLLYFSKKKKNQNWIKTIGSWHYSYKPLIWHIFSVIYLLKKFFFLSVTCPETHSPLVLLSFILFLYFFILIFSSWNSNHPASSSYSIFSLLDICLVPSTILLCPYILCSFIKKNVWYNIFVVIV